jgi:hypothetical protein
MSEPPASGDDSLSASALERVDRLCDAFEAAWQQGQRPRIEDYLGNASGEERDALLRWLIPLDAACRRRYEETPDLRYYLSLSPSLSADWLADVVHPDVPLIDVLLRGQPPVFAEVLRRRLQGDTVTDIAQYLRLSRKTVHEIVRQLKRRLQRLQPPDSK